MSPTVDTLSVWRSLNARSTTSLPAPSTVRPAGRSCTTRSTAALALAGTCPRSRPCLATTPLVRYQIATRVLPGPLEQFLHHLDATIGGRTARLTNKTRADALLKLLAAQRNGWVNETAWAQRIREHLFAHRGRAPDQRQHTDPATEPSLRAPLPQPAIVDF